MFIRRLGTSGATLCVGGHRCPAILELATGDFAVIGTDITDQAVGNFPPDTGCGPAERVVRVPRQTLIDARADIPAAT